MNDEVRRMLREAGTEMANKGLENELISFSKDAVASTKYVYQDVYQRIIQEYKKDPLRIIGNYRVNIETSINNENTHNSDFSKCYVNTFGYLAETYNKRNRDKIVFLSSNCGISNVYFNLNLLLSSSIFEHIAVIPL